MKTESSSFRLEKEVFTEFKKHAKKQNLTANSLINKVMKQYVEWGSITPAIQMVPISASLIVKLLKNSTEEELRHISIKNTEEHLIENILLQKNEESIEAFLESLENWCDASGFPITSRQKNDVTNYTIRHNQGTQYSIFAEESVKTAIELLTGKKAEIKHTINSISFWIQK